MTYTERRRIMIDYLKLKTELEDWHGVSDAANDLREMEARESMVRAEAEVAGTHSFAIAGSEQS